MKVQAESFHLNGHIIGLISSTDSKVRDTLEKLHQEPWHPRNY